MLRCANRFPRLLYFMRADDTPYIHAISPGLERVTWSTAKHAIAERATTPLLHVVQPDEWSQMRRARFAEDSWLVGEQVTDEFEWWE